MPARVEGQREGDWILLDYIDAVVHLFTPDARALLPARRPLGPGAGHRVRRRIRLSALRAPYQASCNAPRTLGIAACAQCAMSFDLRPFRAETFWGQTPAEPFSGSDPAHGRRTFVTGFARYS